jgi:2-iminobutanoate/2-iminopropanoate deaminase
MAIKQAFKNAALPDMRNTFSWGIKITDFKEIFFVTGHGDCNPKFITQHPRDPVAQTQLILNQMKAFIEESGFSIDDIVRTDWTFTNEVNKIQFAQIAALWEAFLKEVTVKPATGTLRYVQRLGMTDMMVEYEMMLAR